MLLDTVQAWLSESSSAKPDTATVLLDSSKTLAGRQQFLQSKGAGLLPAMDSLATQYAGAADCQGSALQSVLTWMLQLTRNFAAGDLLISDLLLRLGGVQTVSSLWSALLLSDTGSSGSNLVDLAAQACIIASQQHKAKPKPACVHADNKQMLKVLSQLVFNVAASSPACLDYIWNEAFPDLLAKAVQKANGRTSTGQHSVRPYQCMHASHQDRMHAT